MILYEMSGYLASRDSTRVLSSGKEVETRIETVALAEGDRMFAGMS